MRPVITVCTGHRCAALLEHAGTGTLPALRSAVRASSQAVLVSTGCVGACAQAPVLAVSEGLRVQGGLRMTDTCWLGPVDREEVAALCGWVAQDVHGALPPLLADVVFREALP